MCFRLPESQSVHSLRNLMTTAWQIIERFFAKLCLFCDNLHCFQVTLTKNVAFLCQAVTQASPLGLAPPFYAFLAANFPAGFFIWSENQGSTESFSWFAFSVVFILSATSAYHLPSFPRETALDTHHNELDLPSFPVFFVLDVHSTGQEIGGFSGQCSSKQGWWPWNRPFFWKLRDKMTVRPGNGQFIWPVQAKHEWRPGNGPFFWTWKINDVWLLALSRRSSPWAELRSLLRSAGWAYSPALVPTLNILSRFTANTMHDIHIYVDI